VYVPLPEPEARRRLVDVLIKNENHILTGADLEEIGQLSEGAKDLLT
jgi:SpoVK/Ycf46/Vps4 family AAA+-type ATPase